MVNTLNHHNRWILLTYKNKRVSVSGTSTLESGGERGAVSGHCLCRLSWKERLEMGREIVREVVCRGDSEPAKLIQVQHNW